MIPILRHRLFISLAEHSKKTHYHHHKNNSSEQQAPTTKLSVKNARRLKRYREKKLSEKETHHLRNELIKQINYNKLTKKELGERIEVLQAHLEIYKNRFEKLTKKEQNELTKKQLTERLGSLVLIEKQLEDVNDLISQLTSEGRITSDEETSLRKVEKSLRDKLSKKKTKIKELIDSLSE